MKEKQIGYNSRLLSKNVTKIKAIYSKKIGRTTVGSVFPQNFSVNLIKVKVIADLMSAGDFLDLNFDAIYYTFIILT